MTRKYFHNQEISKIVDQCMSQWELSHSVEKKQAQLASGAEIDYITISRELGSEGEKIAQDLSELMNWQLYDKEILDYIAENIHVHVRALESVDEGTVDWIKDSLAPLFDVNISQHVEQLSYYKHLAKVLLVISRHGRAIIVGRAAGLVLSRDRGLSVRVTASFEHRCKHIAEKNNIDIENAASLVTNTDEKQRIFVKSFLDQDIDNPKHYDIIFNTEKLPPRAVAKLIWRTFDQRMVTLQEQTEAKGEDVETIVQHQIEEWTLDKTGQEKIDEMQVRLANGAEISYIAISREPGSGGEEVARVLSDLMKWQFYDYKILDFMAKNMDVHVKALESVDEKVRGWIKSWLVPLFDLQSPEHVSQADYYKQLGETLLVIAQHGRAVIMGRAASLVLPRDQGLNVRVTAPFDIRCRCYAKKHNISISKAASIVKKTDKEQKQFSKDFLGKDITDPSHYDLVCSTEKLHPVSVAKLICRAFDQRVMGEHEHSAE